jgi:two-component system sensor histidine kinase UhpB
VRKKIKILIAEHDPVDLELMHYELTAGGIDYIAEAVANETDYANALRLFVPDIILSDFNFPSFDGPAAFKIRMQMAPGTPFIFVSGTIGEEKAVELIKSGVTDYVLKDKLFTLNPKLIRALKETKELTLKKKAEEALLQSEARLARAQQIAHMGSWQLDFSTNMVYWSDEACRIYGLAPGNNLHPFETATAFIHPEDACIATGDAKKSQEYGPDFSNTYRIIRTDGCIRHIYAESRLEFDSKGKPAGMYGIMHDVTERVLLESKLNQARRIEQSEITAAVLSGQEKERADIGTELQENLNQVLSAAKLHIELAKTDELNRQVLLKKSVAYILNVIDEMRKIAKTLANPGNELGLFSSIHGLRDDLLIAQSLEIHFHANDIEEVNLNEKLQLTIFRIVQEQVNNILKHAEATNAVISLSRQANEVILTISDNGNGDSLLKNMQGVGIKNIKARAGLHNGTVKVVTLPGDGYELKVNLCMNSYLNKQEMLTKLPGLY